MTFEKENIDEISKVFGSEPAISEKSFAWKLKNEETRQSLVLNLHNEVDFGGAKAPLVSVQTHHGYYELHNPKAFFTFEPDEVIFIAFDKEKASCIIVGKNCACSVFSNVSRGLMGADFTKLDPPALLAAMQLSLAETLLP